MLAHSATMLAPLSQLLVLISLQASASHWMSSGHSRPLNTVNFLSENQHAGQHQHSVTTGATFIDNKKSSFSRCAQPRQRVDRIQWKQLPHRSFQTLERGRNECFSGSQEYYLQPQLTRPSGVLRPGTTLIAR